MHNTKQDMTWQDGLKIMLEWFNFTTGVFAAK